MVSLRWTGPCQAPFQSLIAVPEHWRGDDECPVPGGASQRARFDSWC